MWPYWTCACLKKHLKTAAPSPTPSGMGDRISEDRREKAEHGERQLSEKGLVSPVLGRGGMRGEEDVLDNACVPLFHCSLPQGIILGVEQEILGKAGQRSDPAQLWPL